MGKVTRFTATKQDPMFGISHENIAPQIHRKNWRFKACCRVEGKRTLYVLIARGDITGEGFRYYVEVHSGDPHGLKWTADFKR